MVGTPKALEHSRARSSTSRPRPLSWLTRYWDLCSEAAAVLVVNSSMCRPAWHGAVLHVEDTCGVEGSRFWDASLGLSVLSAAWEGWARHCLPAAADP